MRIPVLAFQALGHDYSPYFFALSPESFKHRHWLSVHPSKGLLTGRLEDGNPGTTRNLKVDLKYPDGKVGAIEFTVKDSPAHWESRTIRVVSVVKDLIAPESSLKNCWVILQDHLSEIYDFNCRNARQAPFGRWLQCMEKLLLMLRSLPTANLLREVPEAQLPKSAWNGPVLRVWSAKREELAAVHPSHKDEATSESYVEGIWGKSPKGQIISIQIYYKSTLSLISQLFQARFKKGCMIFSCWAAQVGGDFFKAVAGGLEPCFVAAALRTPPSQAAKPWFTVAFRSFRSWYFLWRMSGVECLTKRLHYLKKLRNSLEPKII